MADKKRHLLYPKTEQVSRLLSAKNSLQSSRYQTIQKDFMNGSLIQGGEVLLDVPSTLNDES